MKKQTLLLLLSAFIIFTGCDKNKNEPDVPVVSSVFVTNEGNFSDSNGSITSFDPETKRTVQKAFESANNRPLAGIIQSVSLIDQRLYLVLNNPNRTEVVDPASLTSVGTIETSKTPVSIVSAGDNKAYVSNLYDGSVSIIDLQNLEETGQTIAVGTNPQVMRRIGNRVYVANNGFGNDKTISVINTSTRSIEKTLTVGNGPVDMDVDASNQIWVTCHGLIAYDDDFNRVPEDDVPGSVYIIDGEEATVSGSVASGGHPSGLALNEQTGRGYLLNDGIQIMNLNTRQMQDQPLSSRSFNTIAYSADKQLIYVGQSQGFTQPGQAIRYDVKGTAVDSFATGIAPNAFQFLTN